MTKDEILKMIQPPPPMELCPFSGKWYEVGHVFTDPFAEIRKICGINDSNKNEND